MTMFEVMPAFVTNLDWTNADAVTPEEQRTLERWYKETHGFDPDDEGSLTGFIDFWLRERPDVAKSYRRIIEASCGVDVLPSAAMGLLFLHMYAVMPSRNGVLYEVIASRFWGASRAQVIETLAFAFVHAGPHGMGVATSSADEHLRTEWAEDTPARVRWPAGWGPDPEALVSGIDYFDDRFTDADRERLRAWHLRVEGEVPAYVDFLAERNPRALKAFRHRFETSIRGALPRQMIPLYLMQTAGLRGDEAAMRRAVHMARHFEVTEDQLSHTISHIILYCGDVSMDRAIAALR